MLHAIPWRPLQSVLWDAFQGFLHAVQTLSPGPKPLPANGIPVYVMLPLDVALPSPAIAPDVLHSYLKRLAGVGIHGVLVDVWWRLCEPLPGQYDFARYVALAKTCRSLGLKLQAILSFHACGGNPGDSVSIPLPDWVLEAGTRHKFWFTDRHGHENTEYISFGADYEPVLPAALDAAEGSPDLALQDPALPDGVPRPRTPLQAYANFTQALLKAMEAEGLMGDTITELQVGVGPCGELRYPSYPMPWWRFPGIGEFQCYDQFLLRELAATVREKGSDAVKGATLPPEDAGSYNDTPYETAFFMTGMHTPPGSFFLQWYSDRLLEHAEDVLQQVRAIVPKRRGEGSVRLTLKLSGVHWWRLSASRAAEATCGYIGAQGKPVYEDVAKLACSTGAIVNLTCLEMKTIDTPLRARCGPRQLVEEVFACAKGEGVTVAGENALQTFEEGAFGQVLYSMQRCGAKKESFTLLRLCHDLMVKDKLKNLQAFVQEMRHIDANAN